MTIKQSTCLRCGCKLPPNTAHLLCKACRSAVRTALARADAGKSTGAPSLQFAKFLPECAGRDLSEYESMPAMPAVPRKQNPVPEPPPSHQRDEKEAERLAAYFVGPTFCLDCGKWLKVGPNCDYCPACREKRRARHG